MTPIWTRSWSSASRRRGRRQTPLNRPPPVDTAAALGDTARNAELAQTLIARLIRQLEMTAPTSPTQDLSV
ncbi:MAG: hypothetical protein MO852_09415 [Candidatus Devosia euplotis]|nr:hypothetical protein [Candidatus Devosia euplotis]